MRSSKQSSIKQQTIDLYDQLPQEEEARKARIDIRDKIIELNYSFFGYLASSIFINNSYISYEDKLNSALMHFLECWYWYRWEGHYRTDLSFSTFFRPRVGEMMERELNEVKYSTRRTLCMKVGEQLGKHWGQVRYEDLSDPRLHLSIDDMNSLKCMFGTLYIADLNEHEHYIEAPEIHFSEFDDPSDKYDTIEELLMHEMILEESKLDVKYLKQISVTYGIPLSILRSKLPKAEKMLYQKLHNNLDNI